MSRRIARLLLAAYLAVAAALTLGPLPEELLDLLVDALRRIGDLPYLPTAHLVERAANVALFVPIGVLLCASLPSVREVGVWVGCLVGSTAVEALQSLLPDRTPSLVDVATNGAGAAVGCLVAWAARRSRRHAPSA
jgi:VanZ family protein